MTHFMPKSQRLITIKSGQKESKLIPSSMEKALIHWRPPEVIDGEILLR